MAGRAGGGQKQEAKNRRGSELLEAEQEQEHWQEQGRGRGMTLNAASRQTMEKRNLIRRLLPGVTHVLLNLVNLKRST
jgi:hypothetical protein